ncbi:MAG: hypothetical protein HN356_13670, partial [Calditrichaeota bacterium]|nr:hypothetical protein [Calditrichota bacterium]
MEKIAKILVGLTVLLLCVQANAQDDVLPFVTPSGGEYVLFDIESMDLVGSTGDDGYFSRRSFTSSGNYTLRKIAIMPYNPTGDNTVCDVHIYREDEDNNLVRGPIWSTQIEQIDRWDGERISENWIEIQLQGEEDFLFEEGQSFSIIYGEAPGDRNDGWWNSFMRGDRSNSSFTFSVIHMDHQQWSDFPVEGELLILAGGDMAPANQAPEWVDVPEGGINLQEGQLVAFDLVGRDTDDDDDQLRIAYESDDLPDAVEFVDQENGSATFSWQTNNGDAGDYQATFTLSDGELDVITVVDISITPGPHFEFITTNADASVVINSALLNGEPLELSDEIAVFTPGGICAGAVVIGADDPEELFPTAVAAWGDDPQTREVIEGFRAREEMSFRYWDISAETEIEVSIDQIIWGGDVWASDGFNVITLVANINHEPEWREIPDRVNFEEEELVQFEIFGTDIDEDQLRITYSSPDLPDNATFEDNGDGRGVFSWQTNDTDEGDYQAEFVLSDNEFEILHVVDITIINLNHPPEWEEVQERFDVQEGDLVHIELAGMDPDDDLLDISFFSENLPEDMVEFEYYEDGTALFEWQTNHDDAGDYLAVFVLSDPVVDVRLEVVITVEDVNGPPEWGDVTSRVNVEEGDLVHFELFGTDPDEDQLHINFYPEDLPENATFEITGDGSGVFTWETNYEDAGNYRVMFGLSDDEFEVRHEVEISVANFNRPPEWIEVIDSAEYIEGDRIEFVLIGSDADNQDLTITLSSDNLPNDVEFSDDHNGRASFVWQTENGDRGYYQAIFTLSDEDLEVEAIVEISIFPVPHFEFIQTSDNASVLVNSSLLDGQSLELYDEIAVFTPAGLCAGAVVVKLNQDGELFPTALAAWGDELILTERFVEGFIEDEEMSFRFWDFSNETEIDASIDEIIEGGSVWVDEGFNVITLEANSNRAPEWGDVQDRFEVNEGENLLIQLNGTDPDEDQLSLDFNPGDLPEDAAFVITGNGQGVLSWTPGYGDDNEYYPTFVLSDGEIDTELEIEIIVNNVDVPDVDEYLTPDRDRFELFGDNQFGQPGITQDQQDYYSRARFTVEADYTLRVVAFMPHNPTPNLDAPCDVYIFSERDGGQFEDNNVPLDLDQSIWITTIDRLNSWNTNDFERNWVVLHLPEDDNFNFAAGESFSIVYGTAPGGRIGGDPGWWNYYSTMNETPESFVSLEIDDQRAWEDGRLDGSLVVTAGGFFPVQNTPPEWINVAERVDGNEGETIEFFVTGQDDDGDDLEVRFVNDNLPREAFFRQTANGVGVFTWDPGYDDAGEYACSFVLFDGEDEAEARISFNIRDANEPEEFEYVTPDGEEYQQFAFEFERLSSTQDEVNYYSRISFTSVRNFTPRVLSILLYNPTPNVETPCYVSIFREDEEARLVQRVWETRIDRVRMWNENDPQSNWIELELPNEDDLHFREGEKFSIIYGVAPGGEIGESDGWWNLYSPDVRLGNSYVNDRLQLNFNHWEREELDGNLLVTIGGEMERVNTAPEWITVPEGYNVAEGDLIEFDVEGHDSEGDELGITIISENLPEGAQFIDNEDGTGSFSWQTDDESAGDYSAVLSLTDGVHTVLSAEISISVSNVNQEPYWVDAPEVIGIEEGQVMELVLYGRDPDGDEINMEFDRGDLPEEVTFEYQSEEGRGVVFWLPNYENAGEYTCRFVLSDDNFNVNLEIQIVVREGEEPERGAYITPYGSAYRLYGFDNMEQVSSTTDLRSYYSRASFSVSGDYNLRVIAVMPYNPGANDEAPCYVYVYSENEDRGLDNNPLWGSRIERLERWNEEDILANWIEIELPERDNLSFEDGDRFSIIYGPAPGGEIENNNGEFRNDEVAGGWWNLYSRFNQPGESYTSAGRVERNFNRWEDREIHGDLFILAGGEEPRVNNAPAWRQVPEGINTVEGAEIRFTVVGQDEDGDPLEIEYDSENLPNDVQFTDNEDGTGLFVWTPDFHDDGNYAAQFTLSDGTVKVETTVPIVVANLNREPVWDDVPEGVVQVNEGGTLEVEVKGLDPDEDNLTIAFRSDNLPDEADFRDFHNGEGLLFWEPTLEDEGDYSGQFILSDDEFHIVTDIAISVASVNQAPRWVEYPQPRIIEGNIGDDITFEIAAEDPDNDALTIEWGYLEDPPSDPNVEFITEGGRASFTMSPGRDDIGRYILQFTARDDEAEDQLRIVIDVSSSHYRYAITNHYHTLQVLSIDFFGEEWEGADDMGDDNERFFDEIAVLTENGVVAGVLQPGNSELGWALRAYKDDPDTEPVDGFRNGEEFAFKYWDFQAEVEYDLNHEFITGEQTWRQRESSRLRLFAGANLTADLEVIDFEFVTVDDEAQAEVTFQSVGSIPVDHIEAQISEYFRFERDIPEVVEVGDSFTLTVFFSPDRDGEFEGELILSNELFSTSVALRGMGLQRGHFAYTPTDQNHRIEVVETRIDGERLGDNDEIGVFTPEDLCAGSFKVNGNERAVFEAWGDNSDTDEIDGFRRDEVFGFKVWDSEAEQEQVVDAIYIRGSNRWGDGRFSAVTLITSEDHFSWVESQFTHELHITAIGTAQNLNNILNRDDELQAGDEIAVITPRNVVAGGFLVEGRLPFVFNAYGDNPETENVIEGFQEGEPIYFRVYIQADDREYLARANWDDDERSRWSEGGRNEVELEITSDNREPSWRPVDEIVSAEGEEIRFDVEARDPNHDVVSINMNEDDIPGGVEFTDRNNGTGIFVWTPGNDDFGNYEFTFSAFDGWESSYMTVEVTVRNVNHPPVFAEFEDVEIAEGEVYSLLLEAEDPDGDNISFTAEDLPSLAAINRDENLFEWTPSNIQAGEYHLTFRVTDNGQPPMFDEQVLNIVVTDQNSPPEWDDVEPITASEGTEVKFKVQAHDEEEGRRQRNQNELRLTAIDLPEGAEFRDKGRGEGEFKWETDLESAGEYSPTFIADDGADTDRLVVSITITERNRAPRWQDVAERVEVRIGEELNYNISAIDPDPGDQAELRLSAEDLLQGMEFTDSGEGVGNIQWTPEINLRGMHRRPTFTVTDPNGDGDEVRIAFTVVLVDRIDPVISDLSPANGSVVNDARPVISATVLDEHSEFETIAFRFDNDLQEFEYNEQTGALSFQPEEALDEGIHYYRITAIDEFRNRAVQNVRFEVNAEAGVITVEDLPEYTRRDQINISGEAEEGSTIELWRDGEPLEETVCDRHGEFRFSDVQLEVELNLLTLNGGDEDGNVYEPVDVQTYRDIQPPVVEFITPTVITNDVQPIVTASIIDAGSGVNTGQNNMRNGALSLFIDRDRIDDFDFNADNGVLSYQIDQDLDDGSHQIAIIASDVLGNTPDEPEMFTFFVDNRAPIAVHPFLEGDIEVIGNTTPEVTIPAADLEPSSGLDANSIILSIDDQVLEHVWDDIENSIYYDFGIGAPLDLGDHELSLIVDDNAGNRFEAVGGFRIAEIQDNEPPFFENLWPPRGGIAGNGRLQQEGGGANADHISFVIIDNDAGVNRESIQIWIIRYNGPGEDDDEWILIGGDQIVHEPNGRVVVPFGRNFNDGPNRDSMEGLDEGLGGVFAFGADEDENEGGEEWQFFVDNTNPSPPVLEVPESLYFNTAEISVEGRSGTDAPEYPGGDYVNDPYVLVYNNGELATIMAVELDVDFEVGGIVLVEGENEVWATMVDGGGNESETSDTLRLVLDLSTPTIEDFAAVNGEHQATDTPVFTAIVSDEDGGSGIDADNLQLSIGDVQVPVQYIAEENSILAEVPDGELQDGEFTAQLTIHDLAGNSATTDYPFDIDAGPVNAPTIDQPFDTYTGANAISLTGESEIGLTVHIFLDGEEVGEVLIEDDIAFSFEYAADELPDT